MTLELWVVDSFTESAFWGNPPQRRPWHSGPAFGGTWSALRADYSADRGPWGWSVSPRASMSTNSPIRRERVSIFLALSIR
jgi:hypothetical protein